MTNIIENLISQSANAASNDWRISAGMIAAGMVLPFLYGIGKRIWNKWNAKKAA